MRLDKGRGFEARCFVTSVIFHTVFHTVHNISRCCCYSIYISVSWAVSELTGFPLEFKMSCIFLQSRFCHTVEDLFRVNTFQVFKSDLLRILDRIPSKSKATETTWTFSVIPSLNEPVFGDFFLFFLPLSFHCQLSTSWTKKCFRQFFYVLQF